MLSNMEKPSLIVVIRSGGGACCARHPVDEQRYYNMTLRNLKSILGPKYGTEDYPVPSYNDLAMFSVGWSGGNVMGAGQAMEKTPEEIAKLWPIWGPEVFPNPDEVRKILIRQAVRAVNSLSKTFRNTDPRNDGIMGPLAKIGYNLTKHLFWRRRGATEDDDLSALMNNEMIGNALQLVGGLTHNFAAQDILIPNDRWDKHLQEAGFFDRKLSESPIGIIYGAHNKAKAQPFYLGYVPPHLLSAEFKDGLLLGGHDISHGEAVKAVTTIPFIFKPHKLADDIILEDMILADGPHNLVSWLAMRCPLSPKFGSIKVIYIGSGDRHDEMNMKAQTETVGFERIIEFKRGAKNGSRRAAFATMRRTLAHHNGHHGAEQDLYVIDTADNADRDFTNLSRDNIERIMVEDGEESWRQNVTTFEAIAAMLARNYIVECNFNKAMRRARERILSNWQTACAWKDMLESGDYKLDTGESYDINDEMGPDPIRIQSLEDPTPPDCPEFPDLLVGPVKPPEPAPGNN